MLWSLLPPFFDEERKSLIIRIFDEKHKKSLNDVAEFAEKLQKKK